MRRLSAAALAAIISGCTTMQSTSTFDAARLREIDRTIETAIAEHKLPGGVFHLERGSSVYEKVYGNRALVPVVEPMTDDTIFDAFVWEALRFVPGAVIADSGQRGGLTSLFVRGGESRYNKVIVDGVPVNEPGGVFNFGVVPLAQTDRIEFFRGANSTLYGSDAMTSVVQWIESAKQRRRP